MGYSSWTGAHTWVEYTGDGTDKAGWLNNAEQQYYESVDYCDETTHDTLYYVKADAMAKYFGPYTPASGVAGQGTGSGFVLEYLDGYTGDQLLAAGIPQYTIALWAGSYASPPSGWHVCDGSTVGSVTLPDMRNRFVVGAGSSFAVNSIGGANTVASTATVSIGTHQLTTGEIPAHSHSGIQDYPPSTNTVGLSPSPGLADAYSSTSSANSSYTSYNATSASAHGHTGSTLTGLGTTGNNLPPYKALTYIIKL